MRVEHRANAAVRVFRLLLFRGLFRQGGAIEARAAVMAINPLRLILVPAFLADQLCHSVGLLAFDSDGFAVVELLESFAAAPLSPPLEAGASFFAAS
jgi:hypothetical protein